MRVTQQSEPSFLPEEAWPPVADRLDLSRREVEIARLVVLDLKEFAIACELGISPHTVHSHLDHMYRKLEVGSRLQLVTRLASTYLELVREGALGPVCERASRGRCPLRG